MYKAVVFDCDGTIVNTSIMIDMVYEGYHKVFKDREPLKREHFIPCYFMTDKNIKKYLNVPDEMAEEFDETCFKLADDKILHAKAFDHIT